MADQIEKTKEKRLPADGLVDVVIAVCSHKHNGTPLKKGDKIRVTQWDFDFMIKHNLIEKGEQA